jgi:hypothetical protein
MLLPFFYAIIYFYRYHFSIFLFISSNHFPSLIPFHLSLCVQLDELSLSLDNGRLVGVRSTSSERNTTSFSSSLNNSTPKKTADHSGRSKESSRRNNCSIPRKKDSFLLALINILEDDIYRLIGEKQTIQ